MTQPDLPIDTYLTYAREAELEVYAETLPSRVLLLVEAIRTLTASKGK